MQAQAPDEAPALLLNLDPGHSRLLEVLLQRTEWKRAELEELCNERDLMVDGAIEIINQAAFERFDQALIEQNGQTTYINRELIPEKMV